MKIIIFVLMFYASTIIANTCSIGLDAPINFGIYDPLSKTPNQVTTHLKVICQDGSNSFSISLTPGNSQNYANRKMISSLSELSYNLFLDPAATQVWGDGSNGTKQLSGLVTCNFGNLCSKSIPIYGQIAPLQFVAPGEYSDIITITVNY
jgi:spore coat protein U-like protein